MSLNAFTFELVPSSTVANPIYGLGFGAALWLIAIALTFVAATMNEKELTGKDNYFQFSKYYLLGLIAIIGGLAIHDRVVGNMDEQTKLNHSLAVFKRSQICSIDTKIINLIPLNGSLELAPSKNYYLNEPEAFLKLGIPVVRKDGLDYFLENSNDIESVKSKPASTEIFAILRVDEESDRELEKSLYGDLDSTMRPAYKVSLTSPNGVLGFEQIVMKQYVREYFPSNIEQLVKQTLIIPIRK